MLMAQGGTLDLEDRVLACQVINQPTVARFNAKQYAKELMDAKGLHVMERAETGYQKSSRAALKPHVIAHGQSSGQLEERVIHCHRSVRHGRITHRCEHRMRADLHRSLRLLHRNLSPVSSSC